MGGSYISIIGFVGSHASLKRRERASSVPGVSGFLLAPNKATGSETDPTYRYLRDLDTDAEDTEASRLLYVAATRAESRRHLLAWLECDKDGALKRPTAHTLLSRAWPVAEGSFNAEQAHAGAQDAALPKEIYSINRLTAGWRAPELPKGAQWASPPQGHEEEQIEFS